MDSGDGDGVLIHFGVKGMRWGVRRDRSAKRVDSGRKSPASQEHERARELLKKPMHSLTNAELRDLNSRLQLEQQYSTLTGTNKNRVQRGHARVREFVDMATTVDRAYKLATGPVGQAVRLGISAAVKAA